MKRKISVSLVALALCVPAVALLSGAAPVQKTAEVRNAFETKREIASKLYGRIKIVKSAPDYRVKIVKRSADLRVQIVKKFPDAPGKWQIVDSLPDYCVEIVDVGEDLSIEFVDKFPGVHPGVI